MFAKAALMVVKSDVLVKAVPQSVAKQILEVWRQFLNTCEKDSALSVGDLAFVENVFMEVAATKLGLRRDPSELGCAMCPQHVLLLHKAITGIHKTVCDSSVEASYHLGLAAKEATDAEAKERSENKAVAVSPASTK